ncbi:MAG: DNA alkylation repair protein [bacterium]
MGDRRPTLADVRNNLHALGDPADAEFLQRFFRTAPGEYGAGDKFLGIRVPATRRVARELRALPLDDVVALLHDEWHEARLLGVILLGDGYRRGGERERKAIFDAYVKHARRVNNWDLVDVSAPDIVGAHLASRPRRLLDKLAKSKNLWERRISIVATAWLIRNGEFDDTLRIARALMHDEQDLIHKAVGWMLREVGKRDVATLERFLERHAHEMPRAMLRYSIERLTPAKRKHFMDAKLRRATKRASSSARQ